MTTTLPASPEVILQTMRASVLSTIKQDIWDVNPMLGVICDTPQGVKFVYLPIPKELSETLPEPARVLGYIASQMEATGITPPLHPYGHEGWSSRGFIFMAEGYGVELTREEADKMPARGAIKNRPDSQEYRICSAALTTGEVLSILWERGKEDAKYSGVQDEVGGAIDGDIIECLARMAKVMS